MLPNLIVQNAFKNLTYNRQEADWAVIYGIAVVLIGFWQHDDLGTFPYDWEVADFNTVVVQGCKKFQSRFGELFYNKVGYLVFSGGLVVFGCAKISFDFRYFDFF